MSFFLNHTGIVLVLILASLISSFYLGRAIRNRWGQSHLNERVRKSHQALETVMFALLGLLISFSFAGAADRYFARANLMVQEANAIGTVSLRLGLLDPAAQPALRQQLKVYAALRASPQSNDPSFAGLQENAAKTADLQRKIFQMALDASRLPGSHAASVQVLIPALNEMIDITTTRSMATRLHTPTPLFIALIFIAMSCCVVVGEGIDPEVNTDYIRLLVFSFVVALTLAIIIDMEFPRFGLIQLGGFQNELINIVKQ